MLIEKDIQQILDELADEGAAKIPFDGSNIAVRVVDSKLSLTALVYEGSNYIPSSVRRCLSSKSPFKDVPMLTFFTIDEQNYQVKINYLGHAHQINQHSFKDTLEDFGSTAEKWRLYLDDHDKNDLVYVRVK